MNFNFGAENDGQINICTYLQRASFSNAYKKFYPGYHGYLTMETNIDDDMSERRIEYVLYMMKQLRHNQRWDSNCNTKIALETAIAEEEQNLAAAKLLNNSAKSARVKK